MIQGTEKEICIERKNVMNKCIRKQWQKENTKRQMRNGKGTFGEKENIE